MKDKSKLNLYSLNKRLEKIETTCDPPIEEMSTEINKLTIRLNLLETLISNIQPKKDEKKPSHPEVWDPTTQKRPKNWGRGYTPPVQKTADGTKEKLQKGE